MAPLLGVYKKLGEEKVDEGSSPHYIKINTGIQLVWALGSPGNFEAAYEIAKDLEPIKDKLADIQAVHQVLDEV